MEIRLERSFKIYKRCPEGKTSSLIWSCTLCMHTSSPFGINDWKSLVILRCLKKWQNFIILLPVPVMLQYSACETGLHSAFKDFKWTYLIDDWGNAHLVRMYWFSVLYLKCITYTLYCVNYTLLAVNATLWADCFRMEEVSVINRRTFCEFHCL